MLSEPGPRGVLQDRRVAVLLGQDDEGRVVGHDVAQTTEAKHGHQPGTVRRSRGWRNKTGTNVSHEEQIKRKKSSGKLGIKVDILVNI